MEERVFVRVFTSKKGTRCTSLVVSYGNNREALFFVEASKLMNLLDMKPSEFYDLPVGDYAIK